MRAVTVNGIGTKFYNVSSPDHQGRSTAILWIVFLFFPIFPISRYVIRRNPTDPKVFEYWIISKTTIPLKEVLITYLYGWGLMPAIVGLPIYLLVLLMNTGMYYFGEGDSFFWGITIPAFGIAWLITVTLLWKNFDEKRGLPESKEERNGLL